MWYLIWLLGTAFACGVAVAIGLWYEVHQQRLDHAGRRLRMRRNRSNQGVSYLIWLKPNTIQPPILLALPREHSKWLSGLFQQARAALGTAIALPVIAGFLLYGKRGS